MPGQRGITRTPRDSARIRRNFNRMAILFQNQIGDGLTFDSNGRIIISLDADGGLDFDGAGALGIKLDPAGGNIATLSTSGLLVDQAIIDHGSIAGLGDDDHNDATSGYILRELTGTVVDNTLVRWDGTGGRNLQNSGWTIDDSDTIRAPVAAGSIEMRNRQLFLDNAGAVWLSTLLGGSCLIFTGSALRFSVGNTQITCFENLSMGGNDIIGYAPKESHVDFIALAVEHAFS